MTTVCLTDEQWTKIRAFLRQDAHVYVGADEQECRRFVEAVLWIDRSGAQWRFLPKEYGNWNTVYKRFARWCDRGVWARMVAHFADDPDLEHGILDSTIVRAHPCAAGAEKNGTVAEQALGRSRGGCSTKIHVLVDGLGNPLRVLLTAGQRHASPHAAALLDGLTVLETGREAARRAGRYQARFAARGRTIHTPDALIAGTARAHGAVLVTHNVSDFPMHDIRVERPD